MAALRDWPRFPLPPQGEVYIEALGLGFADLDVDAAVVLADLALEPGTSIFTTGSRER